MLLALSCGIAGAQDWRAQMALSWMPDDEILEAARKQLEAEFQEVTGDRQDVPPWSAYHLWYSALEPDGKKVILVLGSTRDEDLRDVVAIFGGGTSRFRAGYDVAEGKVTYFLFNED